MRYIEGTARPKLYFRQALKNIAKIKQNGQYIVGFAAETNDLLENANRKLAIKNADMIIANSRDIKVIHRILSGQNIGTLFLA
ncbi:MAG: hypothetical protein K2P60_01005, partial [Lachnospiraceae bacterium]|nr:hypothetical protein [Lachnospiraceae bacterium]